ncbi:MAG TPA: DinB family protein [Galbitalea sp.]|nr:DinB family protein [Galbitalea sp.]
MTTVRDDVLGLLDFAWARLWKRMRNLDDEEWSWCPIDGELDISIRWRLEHITGMLAEPRNWIWLGCAPPTEVPPPVADSARAAIEDARAAYHTLRALVGDDALDLAAEIGPAAGTYAEATRRSFVLHIADELIHHAAEAALLRDLYPDRPATAEPSNPHPPRTVTAADMVRAVEISGSDTL